MSLKPAIHHSVPPAGVPSRASQEFREFVYLERLTRPLYTVISYPGMRGESTSIVTSKSILRAIAKAEPHGEPLVAIAHNFTAEALAVLEAQGAVVFRRHHTHWSDASYAAIR